MSLCFDFTEPGFSTGGIAGIAVAAVVGLLLLVGYFGFYRKNKFGRIRLSAGSEDLSAHGIVKFSVVLSFFLSYLSINIKLLAA